MGRNTYSNNSLIRHRRKRKLFKKCILTLILLVAVLVTLCFQLPYFNIKKVTVINNKSIASDDIIKLSDIKTGNNIFYINVKKTKNSILSNPYVSEINVKRKIPDTVILDVKEREAIFYIDANGDNLLISKDGMVVAREKNLSNSKLIKLTGFDVNNIQLGKTLPSDDQRRLKILEVISNLLKKANDGIPMMSSIDLTSMINIKLYYGNMCVMIGDSSNLESKINKAINILVRDNMKTAKGYIDVSFNGNPVVHLEK